MITTLIVLAALIAAWNIAPLLVIATRPGVPAASKMAAAGSSVQASVRGLLVLLPDLLAPLVAAIALLQTKPEDEHLPGWASWWDNDVSINGDQLPGAETYYAPGHDRRSFYARWMWLGVRNRASRLSQMLGYTYGPGEYQDAQSWGDPLTGRDHEGWSLNRRGKAWQIYLCKRLGSLVFRLNFGFKVWAGEGDRRTVANVVNIAASLLSWRGAE